MGLKPGFYGQIFLPCFAPEVYSSYYATPTSSQRPAQLGEILSNKVNYYPTAVGPHSEYNKAVFENAMPMSVPYTTEVTRKVWDYTGLSKGAGVGPEYMAGSTTGFLSVPVGTADFMSSTNVGGNPVFNPYTNYTQAGPNYFASPTFCDPTQVTSATVLWPYQNTLVSGHFVVPIFKDAHVGNWYATINASGQFEPPTQSSNNVLSNQVVYVPAGESYLIFDSSTSTTDL